MIKNITSEQPWVCQNYHEIKSRGVFSGEDPLKYPATILYVQFSLASLLTALLQCILTPLGESSFISQMLVGVMLGPTFFGEHAMVKKLFPLRSFYFSQTLAFLGCLLYIFLVGVKMDLSMATSSGKKGLIIGLSCFLLPLTFNVALAFILLKTISMEPELKKSLISIAAFQTTSSFHVIACLLSDLKLLNSELGRLAVSSSMVSGMLSWVSLVLLFTLRQSSIEKKENFPFRLLSATLLVLFIIYILKPIIHRMIARAAKERRIKQGQIVSIFLLVLLCAFFSEAIGQHFMLGPMVFGLAVPDGPPLGSALVDKLDSYVSSILLPSYFVFSGSQINLSNVNVKTIVVVLLMVLSSFLGKLVGAMLPSLYCKMPTVDALSLGLIMSTQGIVDILVWQSGMLLLLLDKQSYSIMVMATIILTGVIAPIVKVLYDPSKRYMSKRRGTIEHAYPNAELRLLACIYNQESTPSFINFLEISNPTMTSPICFYVLHLIKLTGRSSPLLIIHTPNKRKTFQYFRDSDHIINAFQLYEQHCNGRTIMNALTAIAPYATMHDEICMLALEKRTAMVIVPFHKRWTSQGIEESTNKSIRSVNLNILLKAPCSVGILVERGHLSNIRFFSKSVIKICVIFMGGGDDREALAYAMRMAGNPIVRLTVVRLLHTTEGSKKYALDCDLNFSIINKLQVFIGESEQHEYREEAVRDTVDVVSVIRSVEKANYDLILVGRKHGSDSTMFLELNDWNEYPELGFIGDMLVSKDTTNFEASVLVVQQQSYSIGVPWSADSIKYMLDAPNVVDPEKVCPISYA